MVAVWMVVPGKGQIGGLGNVSGCGGENTEGEGCREITNSGSGAGCSSTALIYTQTV